MNISYMKKIFSILSVGLSAFALSFMATGCVEEVPEVVEDLNLSTLLMPTSTSATVSSADGHTVTFSWANSNNATQYLLQIYRFDTADAPEQVTAEILDGMTPEEVTAEPSESGTTSSVIVELEREYSYYARVCAQNTEVETLGDSKWAAFPYPVDTYTVMDPIEGFSLVSRTDKTITVSWAVASDDEDGINQIRISPNPDDPESAFKSYPVTGEETGTVLDGLDPSTRYTVAAHYNSANRGELHVWTRPSTEGATTVNTEEGFNQALIEAADYATPPLKIVLAYNDGTPYQMGQMDVLGPVEIYGEQTESGESPVVYGYFNLRSPSLTEYKYTDDFTDPETPVEKTLTKILGGTSIRLEALSFNGNEYGYGRNITVGEDFPAESLVSVNVLNCDFTRYEFGIFYDNSKKINYDKVKYESVYVSDISGDGGDNIDIRGENKINSFEIRNSTFTNGIRTFFRADKAAIASFVFANNTMNNLCSLDDGNNKGLFNIRGTAQVFEVKNNLFLNMDGCEGRTVMFPAQATAFPTTVSGNYYFNLTDTFFYTEKDDPSADEFPQSAATAGGGAVLEDDPCYNSGRNILNVTSATVLAAKAGDPRWLTEYVKEPDPELVAVEPGYAWDLTDQNVWFDMIDESCVRGNTKFVINEDPIKVTEDGFEFTAEPVVSYSGIPDDCAMAFLVEQPGSIFVSTQKAGAGTVNDHITVAVGDAEGTSATVMGSVFAGAESQKIVFDKLVPGEKHLVWLYACGPVVLTELEWSDDVNTGSTAVANPEVTPDESVAGALSLSWAAVENASKYIISFGARESEEYGENEYLVETTATTYSWESFPDGTWTVNVQAMAADPDKNDNSEIVPVSVTVAAPEQTPMAAGELTQDDMEFLYAVTAGASNETPIHYKGFLFTARSGKAFKFNRSDNYGAFFNTGGSSDITEDRAGRSIRFIAAGPGKLTYVVCSNGDNERDHGVSVNYAGDANITTNKTKPQPTSMPATWDDYTVTTELQTVSGDVVDLYSTLSVNFISVSWTPTGGSIPFDNDAINEAYMADFSNATTFPSIAFEEVKVVEKVSYVGAAGKAVNFDPEGKRVKFNGKPSLDDNGLPEYRYASFKVTKPGTIYFLLRSGKNEDGGRNATVALAKDVGGQIQVVELYSGFAKTSGSDALSVELTEERLSGTNTTATVYIFSKDNTVNLLQLGFTPAE